MDLARSPAPPKQPDSQEVGSPARWSPALTGNKSISPVYTKQGGWGLVVVVVTHMI